MQFRQMRHFIVVAEELHMHRAAERLNMAQPALSQQIKALEERLGVTLFSRANRRLTLTPAGEAFLVKARLAISLTEQAVLDARQTARGEQGVLNLGCVSSAMFDGRLPAALRQMHTRWPDITMSLVTEMCKRSTRPCRAISWMWPSYGLPCPRCLTICRADRSPPRKRCWRCIVSIRWRVPPR